MAEGAAQEGAAQAGAAAAACTTMETQPGSATSSARTRMVSPLNEERES